MAETEYRRLSCGGCSVSFAQKVGRGRPKKYCSPGCAPKNEPSGLRWKWAAKHERKCARCGAEFIAKLAGAKFCGDVCRIADGNDRAKQRHARTCETCSNRFGAYQRSKRRWCSEECKPKALRGLFLCRHCGVEYKKKRQQPGQGETFCSRDCCFAAKALAKEPVSCAYYAGHCQQCGGADGGRRPWTLCDPCVRAREASRYDADQARAKAERQHKANARVVQCDECEASYCPLYGCKPGPIPLCVVCAPLRLKAQRAAAKALRRARKRAVDAELVVPGQVFARDGWRCRLCGIDTPERLRGTYEPNAPELDHSHPISRGGPHTYANTQCLCRSCNGIKGDMTTAEVQAFLDGEGGFRSLKNGDRRNRTRTHSEVIVPFSNGIKWLA